MSTVRTSGGMDSNETAASSESDCENKLLPARGKIAILNCETVFAIAIDEAVRRMGVESDVLPINTSAKKLKQSGYKAIIISGSLSSIQSEDAILCDEHIFKIDLPVLGICYGMHLMNMMCGGTVLTDYDRLDDVGFVKLENCSTLFSAINTDDLIEVHITFEDRIDEIAPGFTVIGRAKEDVIAIEKDEQLFGIQFYPNFDHDPFGRSIMMNFLHRVSKVEMIYSFECKLSQTFNDIKERVGDKKVLVFVSGGVCSLVSAALLRTALSRGQIVAVHIDTGFFRKNETLRLKSILRRLDIAVHIENAWQYFSEASIPLISKDRRMRKVSNFLCNTVSPEMRQNIISEKFVELSNEIVSRMNLDLQGLVKAETILRIDIIQKEHESRPTEASEIKVTQKFSSYDCTTGAPSTNRIDHSVIEPLKNYYAYDIKMLARYFQLTHDYVDEFEYNFSGLDKRIICAEEPSICEYFHSADAALKRMVNWNDNILKSENYSALIGVNFDSEDIKVIRAIKDLNLRSTLLPIMCLGGSNEDTSYGYAVALSSDVPMNRTILFKKYLYEFSRLITKVCLNIHRVCYVFGCRVKHDIRDVTPTYLKPNVIATIRQADFLASQVLCRENSTVQLPIYLLPIHFDRDPHDSLSPSCQRSLVLKPYFTLDRIQQQPVKPTLKISMKILGSISDELESIPGISRVLIDFTWNPPGVPEWLKY